jgi:hypothetical protein
MLLLLYSRMPYLLLAAVRYDTSQAYKPQYAWRHLNAPVTATKLGSLRAKLTARNVDLLAIRAIVVSCQHLATQVHQQQHHVGSSPQSPPAAMRSYSAQPKLIFTAIATTA